MRFLVLFTLLFSLSYAKEATVTQLFSVQTIKVQKHVTSKSFTSYGFIKPDDARIYDVAPRFGGYVETLYADKLYQEVKKDQLLAKVYSPEVLKAKDDYISTLKYNMLKANQAMLEASKQKLELLNIPSSEIKHLQNTLKSTTDTQILSPSDGFIFHKALNNRSAFKAKQKLFSIVNLDVVWVELKIHQNELRDLQKVQNFSVKTAAYLQSFSAKKIQLYPQLDPKKESMTLRLEVQNKKHLLLPGMYVNVTMSEAKKEYLTLPATAVIRKNGKFYVFGVGEYEGEYEPKEVKLTVLDPDTYIVNKGLVAGDEVVNNAMFLMDSDAQINGMWSE